MATIVIRYDAADLNRLVREDAERRRLVPSGTYRIKCIARTDELEVTFTPE